MVDSIVSFAVERLAYLLIQEVKLLSGVSQQVNKLQLELKRMRCFLKDAERRQDEDESIKNWVSEIRYLAQDAEDVIESYALEAASRNRIQVPWKKGWSAHKVASRIQDIESKISDLTRSLQTYGLSTTRNVVDSSLAYDRQHQTRSSYAHVIGDFVVGLDEDTKVLVHQLARSDEKLGVVSIFGMGGLGKTTLAKKVYHHNEIRRHFDGFAWAYISQQCKKRDVWQGVLLQVITPSNDERDEILKMRDEELAAKLYKFLQSKRCLVILDDIWNTGAWDILSPAFPMDSTQSKIMLTSRNKEVALHVDQKSFLHEPGCLNEAAAWELFQKKAFLGNENSVLAIRNVMEKLGREMLAKCGGLPLAIIVLGGLLATKETLSEWETIHKYVTTYLMRGDAHESQSKLFEVLDLSYHDLPWQLKPCFLYLSHFPEDSDIPRSKLIRLWVAEGIASSQHENDRYRTMEYVAEGYLNNLINRCMVQVGVVGSSGRIKTCRLHDLMRDLCLSKARKENFLEIAGGLPENRITNFGSSSLRSGGEQVCRVRRLAVFLDQQVNEIIPSYQQGNMHLRSLLYFHEKKFRLKNWEAINVLFDRFKLLRTLDLEGIKGESSHSLPTEVGKLLWLKFLSLKRTHIRTLPSSIGNLQYLQTLNLQTFTKSWYWDLTVEIPDVIWKLKRLRHLYLPNWCGNISDRLQLANLTELQTLVNFPANKCNIEDLLKLTNLTKLVLTDPRHFESFGVIFDQPDKSLKYLQSLSLTTNMLSFPDEVINVQKILLGCPSLHKLHTEGRIQRLPEIGNFPPYIAKLTLWGSRLVDDPMPTLEKLPYLKYLSGWELFVGKTMKCSQYGFPQLKSLRLRNFPNLEEWTVEDQSMPSLCKLGISDCNRLGTVPDGFQFISTLKELEIRWMPISFRNRLGNGQEDYHKVQHIPSIVFLN